MAEAEEVVVLVALVAWRETVTAQDLGATAR